MENNSATFLGAKVRDGITGFEGVVTGYVQYLTGCNQVLVMGRSVEGKPADAVWFDEQRVTVDADAGHVVLDNSKTPGFDAPAPIH